MSKQRADLTARHRFIDALDERTHDELAVGCADDLVVVVVGVVVADAGGLAEPVVWEQEHAGPAGAGGVAEEGVDVGAGEGFGFFGSDVGEEGDVGIEGVDGGVEGIDGCGGVEGTGGEGES